MALGWSWAPTRLFPILPSSTSTSTSSNGSRLAASRPRFNRNRSFFAPSFCNRCSSLPSEIAKKNCDFRSSSGGSTTIISGFCRVVRRRRLLLGVGTFSSFVGMAEGGSSSFTASATPSRTSQVEEVLNNVEWPEKFPFKEEDFQRYDESSDSLFYSSPRFVTHIDDPAINALTKYYSKVLPPSDTPGVCLLDLCSSWVSHYPLGYKQERIVGLGMNEEELKRNPVLTEYAVQDLNIKPELPFEDSSFDVITNVVSVDYLTKPIIVFKEMARILKPGGLAIMSFSNRCFWTKAISIWTSTGDVDHAWIVGSYFHYAGGFEPPQAVDISPNPGRTDPMYIVFSRKLAA